MMSYDRPLGQQNAGNTRPSPSGGEDDMHSPNRDVMPSALPRTPAAVPHHATTLPCHRGLRATSSFPLRREGEVTADSRRDDGRGRCRRSHQPARTRGMAQSVVPSQTPKGPVHRSAPASFRPTTEIRTANRAGLPPLARRLGRSTRSTAFPPPSSSPPCPPRRSVADSPAGSILRSYCR